MPYDGDIKIVEVPPWLRLGLDDVHLAEGKGMGGLEVGEDGFGRGAEAAVCAGEEGDADGLVEGRSEAHCGYFSSFGYLFGCFIEGKR